MEFGKRKKEFKWEDIKKIKFPDIDNFVICINSYQGFKKNMEYKVIKKTKFHIWLCSKGFNEVGFNKQFFYNFFKMKI